MGGGSVDYGEGGGQSSLDEGQVAVFEEMLALKLQVREDSGLGGLVWVQSVSGDIGAQTTVTEDRGWAGEGKAVWVCIGIHGTNECRYSHPQLEFASAVTRSHLHPCVCSDHQAMVVC
jgi:hypothetical protein